MAARSGRHPRGVGRGPHRRRASRGAAGRGPRVGRAAPADAGRLRAGRPRRGRRAGAARGAGGQGHHVRLGWAVAQDRRRHGHHEDRHERRGGRARPRCRPAGTWGCGCGSPPSPRSTENMPGGRAIKPGDVLTIRNGEHHRGAQHRRRGAPGAGRRPVAGGRAGARRHHRPGDADRCVRRGAGHRHRRPVRHRRRPRWAGAGGLGRVPGSRRGRCRCPRSTGSTSTPTSPT